MLTNTLAVLGIIIGGIAAILTGKIIPLLFIHMGRKYLILKLAFLNIPTKMMILRGIIAFAIFLILDIFLIMLLPDSITIVVGCILVDFMWIVAMSIFMIEKLYLGRLDT